MKRAFQVLSATAITVMTAQAHASFIAARVNSVSKDRSQILIESTRLGTLQRKNILIVNNDCSLEIVKRSKTKAVLSTENCATKSTFAKGQNLSLRLDVEDGGSYSSSTTSYSAPVATARTTVKIPETSSGFVDKGVRFSLTTSLSSLSAKTNVPNTSTSTTVAKNNIGLGLGYAYAPEKSFGFYGRGIYSFYADSPATFILLEANGTYGLSRNTFLYAGLNMFRVNIPSLEELGIDYEFGFGGQVGLGIKFSEIIGMEIGLSTRNTTAEVFGFTSDANFTGLDLALTATF